MNLDDLIACALCAIPLNEESVDGGGIRYEHPVSPDEDHEPQPVPAHQVTDLFLRCHLCSAKYPVFNYRTARIEAATFGGLRDTSAIYSTQWHVCYPCGQLIEADDSDALTERSATAVGWSPGNPKTTILRALHRTIVLSRVPQRALLTTTDWPDATLVPDALPQIRERLSGLLRGPVLLPPPLDTTTREAFATRLDQAPLYWINQEFTNLIASVTGNQPPAAITDRIVPTPSGLLAWPRPVGTHRPVAAVSWRPHSGGWEIIAYRSIGNYLPKDAMSALRREVGWLVPTYIEHIASEVGIDGDHPLAPLVTTWLLMAQQMAEATSAKLSSSARKAYQRNRRTPPDVRLVRIKAPSQDRSTQDSPAKTTSGRARPDYRYWVTGHERNQAYGPGRSLRKRIDIDPFLKGPEDKPIKMSTTVRILGNRRTTTSDTEQNE